MQEGDEKSARIDEKKRPKSLFFENYRFTIPIWGIAICRIFDLEGLLIIRHYLQMEVLAQWFLLIRCCPNCANHCLTGSAFLEGIRTMIIVPLI